MKNKKNILVITPTATHPQNAGNRARIYSMLDQLQKMGFAVHVLYNGNEKVAGHVKRRHNLRAMAKKWDGFYYVPNKFSAYLLKQRLKSKSPLSRRFFSFFHFLCLIFPNRKNIAEKLDHVVGEIGKVLKRSLPVFLFKMIKKFFPDGAVCNTVAGDRGRKEIDLWYEKEVDYTVRALKEHIVFDVVLVEYVFMSKALEHFGDGVLKIIDTHDVFSNRREKYAAFGLKDLSFSVTPAQEALGLSRADVVLAIQEQEKIYFETLIDKPVVVVGHFIPTAKLQKHSVGKRILFIGAANPGNIHTAQYFIDKIFPRIQEKIPNAKFVVAGKVANHVKCSKGCELMGEVKSLAEIYRSIDVVVNPALVGTGLKIKNLEALGFGKPLISSSHAACGMEKADSAIILADTPKEFSQAVVKILSDPALRGSMSESAEHFAVSYNKTVKKTLSFVFNGEVVKNSKVQKTKPIFSEQKNSGDKFIIFTCPRTGATTLTHILNKHPYICIADEPFHHKTGRSFAPTDIVGVNEYITELWKSYNGIKHNWGLSFEQNINLLLNPDHKIIFLWRQNALQREVSLAISQQTGKWNSSKEDREDIIKRTLEPLNVDEIKKGMEEYLFEIEQYKRLFKKQGKDFYEITYEELYDSFGSYENKVNIIQDTIEFLEKDPTALKQDKELKNLLDPNISKVNSKKTYRVIPNIDEVEKILGSDKTGWLLR